MFFTRRKSWLVANAKRWVSASRNSCGEALGRRPIDGTQHGRGRELYGFNPIRAGGKVVTDELVIELRDELGV